MRSGNNGISVFPQKLFDINHNFGEDIQASSTGDLGTVSDEERSKQRILRRLLTPINGYIWHTNYGAGIPSYIGQGLDSDAFSQIKSLIKSQISLEDSVAQNPAPVTLLQTIAGGIYCQINYFIDSTQNPITLNFNLGI